MASTISPTNAMATPNVISGGNATPQSRRPTGTTRRFEPSLKLTEPKFQRLSFQNLKENCKPSAIAKNHRTTHPNSVPRKEPPLVLQPLGVILLIAFEIFILGAITVLWVLTTKRNGFVNVPDTPSSIIDSHNIHGAIMWAYALLWTFLPAFIVSMCGKLFTIILDALTKCQPTIELRKHSVNPPNAPPDQDADAGCILPLREKFRSNQNQNAPEKSTAKLTVLLDYGKYLFPLHDCVHAFQNRHFLIGACMLVKWLYVAIGPLAAAIISIANVPASSSIQVTANTFFDVGRNESSSRPAFESASAILLNDGIPFPWTSNTSSVVPFYAQTSTAGNLTATTRSYSASLDCQSIDVDSLAGNITRKEESGGNVTTFTFTDRGCTMAPWLVVGPSPPLYMKVRFGTCNLEDGRARLVFLNGVYDSSISYLLGNFSLISCIPYFWNSTSLVSVVASGNVEETSGQIVNISTTSPPKRFWPEFWQRWVSNIPDYTVEDPTLPSLADDFAILAYNYASQSNGTIDFLEAMNTSFSVAFAAFAAISTYSPLEKNVTFTGSLTQSRNRLFIVRVPAAVVVSAMGVSLLVSLWIAFYTHKHRVTISQHLDLILGHAILLQENEGVNDFIIATKDAAAKQDNLWKSFHPKESQKIAGEDANFVEYASKDPSLELWNCWVGEDGRLHMTAPAPETVVTAVAVAKPSMFRRLWNRMQAL